MLTNTYDTVKSVPLTAENLGILVDLEKMHKLVMSNFMHLNGMSDSARAVLQVTFKTVLPTDQGGKRGECQVHIRSMEKVDESSVPSVSVSAGDTVKLSVRLSAAKRNSTRGGKDEVRPVGDNEIAEWTEALLSTHGFSVAREVDTAGFEVPSVRTSKLRWTGRRDTESVRFPVRDINAVVTVVDAVKANAAIVDGVGRGKNYGLGLVVVNPV